MNFNPPSPTAYEYIHYTGEVVEALDLNRTYDHTERDFELHKPNGLWLSITGVKDWYHYCHKKKYRLENLKTEFQIILKPTAKILFLNNNADYENFAINYSSIAEKRRRVIVIHWDEIINEYQGLALPHLNPDYFSMVYWQHSWCCTSACIWDLQAIKKVVKLT